MAHKEYDEEGFIYPKKNNKNQMKKYFSLSLLLIAIGVHAQYLIVGQDSITLKKFKEENKYSLENSGVEKTINSVINFRLLQQFAKEQKADTIAYFRTQMFQKEQELRNNNFYPRNMEESLLKEYLSANQIEQKVLMFFVQKEKDDKNDYTKIYNEVKSGKISMEEAIKKYTKGNAEAVYIKTGLMDHQSDLQLQRLQVGEYSSLVNTASVATFMKLVAKRPSLGYLYFGTLSYPNNAEAENTKKQIEEALKSGKKFEEVAKIYGSTQNEKENGGLVTGSPTLPDEVYEQLKNKKEGEYSQPILIGNQWFIFNIYSKIPYVFSEKYNDFFIKEMKASRYGDVLAEKLIESLKASSAYKEYADFQKIKKSYQEYASYKNPSAILYEYKGKKFTYADLKKEIDQKIKNTDKIPAEQWSNLLDFKNKADIYQTYEEGFYNQPNIKEQLESHKQHLYANYIYSHWLKGEIENHPEKITAYYQQNKEKYILESHAKGRVAILSDESLKNKVEKEIAQPQNWENLKKEFVGKLNTKNQILVYFEEGEMSENADVFKVHRIPFSKGVHHVKMGERTLVIAIDEILPSRPMTLEEAKDKIEEVLTEQKLTETIAQQRLKTKITIQPSFQKDLEQNFKK